ncbi:MAG TPA: CAP domain-containing protein [Gaiellaceae bacterium]|nr:CAP domain-containing protein [Gaiellaceae bacterium]
MPCKRLAALAALAAVLVAHASSSFAKSGGVTGSARLQSALLAQVNAVRSAHGLVRLHFSTALNAAASAHSTQMARLGYFSHNSANGTPFSRRIATYYPAHGYRSWMAGENLVWASPDLNAARAVKLWLASPPHRANLLNPSWREIGLSGVHSTSAPGVYGGSAATIITADFGARSR